MATLSTLATFTYANRNPYGSLVTDASGDLLGTTFGGGPSDYGTVFEVTKTGSSYASTPTTLVSFDGANGQYPTGALFVDANGDLFGTTEVGGSASDGTVFEVAQTGSSYASTQSIGGFTTTAAVLSALKSDGCGGTLLSFGSVPRSHFEPELADSLHNLSIRLAESGDGAAALTAIRDAVEILSNRLADSSPEPRAVPSAL